MQALCVINTARKVNCDMMCVYLHYEAVCKETERRKSNSVKHTSLVCTFLHYILFKSKQLHQSNIRNCLRVRDTYMTVTCCQDKTVFLSIFEAQSICSLGCATYGLDIIFWIKRWNFLGTILLLYYFT